MTSVLKRVAGLVFPVLLLAGCALSPQQVKVAPELEPGEENMGNGREVVVLVDDARENKVIGTRGGAYKESSEITLANDLADAVARAVRDKLRSMGFLPVNRLSRGDESVDAVRLGGEDAGWMEVKPDSYNGTELRIIIDKLQYRHPDEAVMGYDAELLAEVRARVVKPDETFEGRYKVKNSRRFFNAPSAEHNAELINETLADALERAFADPKLRKFLME